MVIISTLIVVMRHIGLYGSVGEGLIELLLWM